MSEHLVSAVRKTQLELPIPHGIANEDLPRVFDRFFRARHGEESLADSTGLGLAIAKRILELHGSQIEVTSRVSEGTCFEFELPVDRLAA